MIQSMSRQTRLHNQTPPRISTNREQASTRAKPEAARFGWNVFPTWVGKSSYGNFTTLLLSTYPGLNP